MILYAYAFYILINIYIIQSKLGLSPRSNTAVVLLEENQWRGLRMLVIALANQVLWKLIGLGQLQTVIQHSPWKPSEALHATSAALSKPFV